VPLFRQREGIDADSARRRSPPRDQAFFRAKALVSVGWILRQNVLVDKLRRVAVGDVLYVAAGYIRWIEFLSLLGDAQKVGEQTLLNLEVHVSEIIPS
jgi:hypothetical protein